MPKARVLRQVVAGGRVLTPGTVTELGAAALKRLAARGLVEPVKAADKAPAAEPAPEPVKAEPKPAPKAHRPARAPAAEPSADGAGMSLSDAQLKGAA